MRLFERIERVRAARKHTAAGIDAYERGDLGGAEAEFTSALWFAAGLGTGDDTARRAYMNLAVAYIDQGKYLEGRQVFRQALALGLTDRAPATWEPVPIWGFYSDAENDQAMDRLLAGVRRVLSSDTLNPAKALHKLAEYEETNARTRSALALVSLAEAL